MNQIYPRYLKLSGVVALPTFAAKIAIPPFLGIKRRSSHVTSLKAGYCKVPCAFVPSDARTDSPQSSAMAISEFPQLREYVNSLPVIDVLALH